MTDARPDQAPVRTVALCVLGALCEGFDVQAAGVAAAGLSQELHPGPQALGLFFSASGAGLLLGALLGGRLSDRVGRKAVLVASIAAFGVCSLLTSLAPDMDLLIAARLLTGLGLGGAMPNLMALAADSSRAARRGGSIAAAYVGMPLGAVGASLIASAVAPGAWRLVFQVGGLAPLAVVPMMLRWLPSGAPLPREGAEAAPDRGLTRRALFGEGRAGTTLLLWASFFLLVLTLHLMINWLPLLLVGRGLAPEHAALAQAVFNVGGAATGLGAGVLLDSRWKGWGIGLGPVALPAALVLLALTPPVPGLMFGLALLLGGSIISGQVLLYAVAAATYEVSARGTATGAAVAAGRLGSLVGPLAAGTLLAAGRSPAQVLMGVLPLALACGAGAGLLGWRRLGRGTPGGLPNPAATD
jgi:MFS transporter, AAHS family, 3-hydroxyphenylpropionic acid transporter